MRAPSTVLWISGANQVGQGGTRADAELPVEVIDVGTNGGKGDTHCLGNLVVGLSVRYFEGNLRFACREAVGGPDPLNAETIRLDQRNAAGNLRHVGPAQPDGVLHGVAEVWLYQLQDLQIVIREILAAPVAP